MFNWLKNLRLNEQKKIMYQNLAASDGILKGYFAGNRVITHKLESLNRETRTIALSISQDELVSNNDRDTLLEINRELRELYDQTATKHLKSFDSIHTPVLGWKKYYKRHEL